MKEYTEQAFFYKQVPVDYDGIAKIKSIKGNSIVWNQLRSPIVMNTSLAGINIIQTNDGKCVMSGTSTGMSIAILDNNIRVTPNHKYLIRIEGATFNSSRNIQVRYSANGTSDSGSYIASVLSSTIITYTNTTYPYIIFRYYFNNNVTINDTFYLSLYDLTQIFGAGNEPSTVEEFTSLFTLPYYQTDSGNLLSFNGNGIKTTGKNQIALHGNATTNGIAFADKGDGTLSMSGTATADAQYQINIAEGTLVSGNYYIQGAPNQPNDTISNMYVWDQTLGARAKKWNKTTNVDNVYTDTQRNEVYIDSTHRYTIAIRVMNGRTVSNLVFKPMLTFSDADATFEPYQESTTTLPISTYFPTGMKSAGNVYDELTESKAITRIGRRAYQNGDENNPSVITDGTNTYYALSTPVEVSISNRILYPFYQYGTEQILPVNGSSPTTSYIICDVDYFTTIEGETPYRRFWLVNGEGERWDLTDKEFKCFLNNPTGLGFRKNIEIIRYGERANKTSEIYDFPQPQGELLFYDSSNSSRYDKYNDFVRFVMNQPITLYYMIPVSYMSGIANTYKLDCEIAEVQKTESKTDHFLTSNIVFNGLEFYKGEEISINGTGNTYTLENEGDFPVGFEITIEGSLRNPYITLEQDGELYGEAKFTSSTAFSSVYVDSNDGEQNVELMQGSSILPNPLSYQDLSISNGSIYVTFVKLARETSTLKIGMDSGNITGVSIKYSPQYRSV